jgi:replicative DNA helicase
MAPGNGAPTREDIPPTSDAPALRIARLGDLLAEWALDAEEAYDARVNNRPRGPITALPRLDQELGGAFAKGLHVIHGNTGTGKTAFVLQVGASSGCPTLFVSTEMGLLELMRRHTARVTGTFLQRLKSGELAPAMSLGLARQAAQAAPQLVLADATLAYASPDWVRAVGQSIRGDARHLLIVVDSLNTWADQAPGDIDEYNRLNAGLGALQKLATRLDCVVLVTAERNRASMKAGGVNAGAGSRRIEYGAETVLDLDRDPEAREDAGGEVPITIKLAKNRHGPAGRKIETRFHGALQRFTGA